MKLNAKTEKFLDMKKAVDIWELTGAHPALYIYLLAVNEAASSQGFGKVLAQRTPDKVRSAAYPLLRILHLSVGISII